MYRHADGRFMSFFGDLHPVLRRQCRKGDGRRQAGLSGADADDGETGAASASPAGILAEANRDWRARSCASIG
jgi:hypothetical protein